MLNTLFKRFLNWREERRFVRFAEKLCTLLLLIRLCQFFVFLQLGGVDPIMREICFKAKINKELSEEKFYSKFIEEILPLFPYCKFVEYDPFFCSQIQSVPNAIVNSLNTDQSQEKDEELVTSIPRGGYTGKPGGRNWIKFSNKDANFIRIGASTVVFFIALTIAVETLTNMSMLNSDSLADIISNFLKVRNSKRFKKLSWYSILLDKKNWKKFSKELKPVLNGHDMSWSKTKYLLYTLGTNYPEANSFILGSIVALCIGLPILFIYNVFFNMGTALFCYIFLIFFIEELTFGHFFVTNFLVKNVTLLIKMLDEEIAKDPPPVSDVSNLPTAERYPSVLPEANRDPSLSVMPGLLEENKELVKVELQKIEPKR